MAKKPSQAAVEVIDETIKWGDEPGKVVEGRLLSVELNQTTSQGLNNVYRLEDENGHILTVFGSTVLNRKLQSCNVGDWVIITFVETMPGTKAGRTIKMFKVERIPCAPIPDDELAASEQSY